MVYGRFWAVPTFGYRDPLTIFSKVLNPGWQKAKATGPVLSLAGRTLVPRGRDSWPRGVTIATPQRRVPPQPADARLSKVGPGLRCSLEDCPHTRHGPLPSLWSAFLAPFFAAARFGARAPPKRLAQPPFRHGRAPGQATDLRAVSKNSTRSAPPA